MFKLLITRRTVLFLGVLIVLVAGFYTGWWIRGTVMPAAAVSLVTRPIDVPSNLLTVSIVPLVPSAEVAGGIAGSDKDVYEAARELTTLSSLEELAISLGEIYPFQYEVSKSLELPDEFYDAERGQYRIDKLVDWLEENRDENSFRVIGVMAEDVFKPEFNYLFGLAHIVGPGCVASTRRMGGFVLGAQTTAAERWHALAAHELGHTLGLPHNERERSLMAYSDSLAGLDRQCRDLSPGDKQRLREILPVRWVK